eukprot:5536133-Amphidinium_carterae.1
MLTFEEVFGEHASPRLTIAFQVYPPTVRGNSDMFAPGGYSEKVCDGQYEHSTPKQDNLVATSN